MDLAERWPLPVLTGARDRLLVAYGAPTRGYHDRTHLAEVLDHVEELRHELGDAGDLQAVLLATWFHDAVYDGAEDDEERSARLAEHELAGTSYAGEVARLVRLTKGHQPSGGDRSGQVLCDADLAILAAEEDRYAAYVAGVRREHDRLDDRTFRRGRAAVLRDLLARPTLFHTPTARSAWEERARANVDRELRQLDST